VLQVVSWQLNDQSVKWDVSLMFENHSGLQRVGLVFNNIEVVVPGFPFDVKLGPNSTPLIPWLTICDLISEYRDLEEFRFV
jgi:hypothetical protein